MLRLKEIQHRYAWICFQKVLSSNPDIFPEKFINKNLFINLLEHVCTRVFKYKEVGTVLIPMADNLNHSCMDFKCQVISLPLHVKGNGTSDYYDDSKYFIDYHQVFKSRGWTSSAISKNKFNLTGRVCKEIYISNKE